MEKKLNFTDQALNQINLITKGDEKKYFRITVQGGGCSGFKYNFGFDSKMNRDDIIFGKTIIENEGFDLECPLYADTRINILIFEKKYSAVICTVINSKTSALILMCPMCTFRKLIPRQGHLRQKN